MKLRIKARRPIREWILLAVFYLLVFQSPLEEINSIFKYIDEVFALIGLAAIAYTAVSKGAFRMRKATYAIVVFLLIFVFVGLLGNWIYKYQTIQAVLTDFYVNLKFFLSILSGYVLFKPSVMHKEFEPERTLASAARFVAVLHFVLVCLDLAFHIFPSPEYRYGIRVEKLFYFHPTYLAGAMIFVLAVLLAFYEKKNLPYMAMTLVVLCLTLRGKALSGAAAYVAVFYFIVIYRKKLRLWHIAAITLAGIAIGWEQFSYYYLELSDESARSVLTITALEIMGDYFPIGTGFGTYASASAMEYYSPVYIEYGLYTVHGLSEDGSFGSDTFWPIIIGQTGLIGTVCFVAVILLLFKRVLGVRKLNIHAYAAGIFAFAYLMVSSTSEPSFHNSVAIPLALILGYIFTLEQRGTPLCPKN